MHRSLGNPDFPFGWRFTGVAVAPALVAGPQSQPYHCTERDIDDCTNESRKKKPCTSTLDRFIFRKEKIRFRQLIVAVDVEPNADDRLRRRVQPTAPR